MASSVSSYFIMHTTPPNQLNDGEDNEKAEKEKKQVKKNKTNKSKQLVITRNELTRKRMTLIRSKLEESRARHFEKVQNQALNCSRSIPRVADVFTPSTKDKKDPDIETAMEMVPISNTGEEVPYVYFVVSPEKQEKVTKVKAKLKERQRDDEKRKQLVSRSTVFTTKEDYGIFTDKSKTMTLAHNFGLPSQPMSLPERPSTQKQIVFPLPIKLTPKNPPTTPATTITTSIGHRGSRDWDYQDFETIYEKPIKMTICEDNEIVETREMRETSGKAVVLRGSTRSLSTKCLELPFISLDEQRKALGTAGSYGVRSLDFVRKSVSQDSSQKRVHFAESVDLPSIKGSQISSFNEILPSLGLRPLTVPDFSSEKSKSLSDLKSLTGTRLLHSSSGRSYRSGKSLDLPKIDIVSSVYDELILKAIEAYIMSLPPYSKQSQIARQLLDQLQNKTISTSELDKDQYKSIREDIANLPRNTVSQRGRQQKNNPRKGTAEKCFSPLEPKCYRLVLPGALPPGPSIKVLQS